MPSLKGDDILLTILGAIVGFLLALFVQPLVQPHVDRLLAKSPFAFRRKRSISGLWAQTWHVDSDNFQLCASSCANMMIW